MVNGGASAYKNLATGQPLNLDGTIGGAVKDTDGKVTSASALRIGFLTKVHQTVVDGEEIDERGDEFEQKLLDLLQAGVPGVELTFILQRSFGDEFGAAITVRLFLVIFGYFWLFWFFWLFWLFWLSYPYGQFN